MSPETEGRWVGALLTWWMSPDFTLQLTSEHFVSPNDSHCYRKNQSPLLPLPLHTWSQAMRPCPMPLPVFGPGDLESRATGSFP